MLTDIVFITQGYNYTYIVEKLCHNVYRAYTHVFRCTT